MASTLLFSGCAGIPRKQPTNPTFQKDIQVALHQYQQSHFKQVEATFYTHRSKEHVFGVLSNVQQTSQWLERVDSLDVLKVYNNHQYLLRTVIDSPWPFKNRELITCVDTLFEENMTTIKITSCSERVPKSGRYVRIAAVESSWVITTVADSLVEINYKTWLDPLGNVPAFIFNSELIDSTQVHLQKLQRLINNAPFDASFY